MRSVLGMSLTEAWLFLMGLISLLVEVAGLIWPERLPLISPTMRANGGRWVLWPALLGVLSGHFWSPTWLAWPALRPAQAWILPAVGLCLVAFDLFGPRVSSNTAFMVCLVGLFFGAIFWSQVR